MKRLRKLCPTARLKYYACGEYGTDNRRPHYHAIIFNVHNAELYNEAWGKGIVHVGNVSGDSIAYTMKYIDKPPSESFFVIRGGHKVYLPKERDDREKEFSLMSKGMGANYLSPEIVNYHRADLTRLYATKPGGHKIALPRYYRNKIYTEQEQKLQPELIQQKVARQETVELFEYKQIFGDNNLRTFDEYKDLQRLGRHRRFYSQLKKRNV